jgi:hypothetical protein
MCSHEGENGKRDTVSSLRYGVAQEADKIKLENQILP